MLYRTKPQFVEAFQYTAEVRDAWLFDRVPVPFGISISGHYHPERREVYTSRALLPANAIGVFSRGVELGQWVLKDEQGRFEVLEAAEFEVRFELHMPDGVVG